MAEHDAMQCRACGREERASEGYPCHGCGTFICQLCDMKGVVLCRACQAKQGADPTKAVPPAAPA